MSQKDVSQKDASDVQMSGDSDNEARRGANEMSEISRDQISDFASSSPNIDLKGQPFSDESNTTDLKLS